MEEVWNLLSYFKKLMVREKENEEELFSQTKGRIAKEINLPFPPTPIIQRSLGIFMGLYGIYLLQQM